MAGRLEEEAPESDGTSEVACSGEGGPADDEDSNCDDPEISRPSKQHTEQKTPLRISYLLGKLQQKDKKILKKRLSNAVETGNLAVMGQLLDKGASAN